MISREWAGHCTRGWYVCDRFVMDTASPFVETRVERLLGFVYLFL